MGSYSRSVMLISRLSVRDDDEACFPPDPCKKRENNKDLHAISQFQKRRTCIRFRIQDTVGDMILICQILNGICIMCLPGPKEASYLFTLSCLNV